MLSPWQGTPVSTHFTTFQDLLQNSLPSHSYLEPERRKPDPDPRPSPPPPLNLLQRFPGDFLPSHPLTCTLQDPTIVERALKSLERGLTKTGVKLEDPLLPLIKAMLDLTFGKHGGVIPIPERHLEAQLHLNSLFKFVIMPTMSIFLGKEVMDNVSSYLGWGGGRVEEGAAMECRVGRYIVKEHSEWDEGYFEVLNAVPCEPRLVGELKSLYREEIGEEDEKWPALGSNQPLDLRMLDENGQSRRLEGASAVAAKLALRMLERPQLNPDFRPHEPLDRRFAFLYGPPYFVLSELDKRCSCLPLQHSPPWPLTPPPTSSVIHEGRSYLLIGDLNSSVADPEDGAVPSVPFLGLWTALLLFHLPDFEIERPSEERIEVLGEAGRELEKRDVERLRKVEGHSGLNKILDGSMLGSERLWKAGDSVRSATIFSSSRLSEDEGWVSFFEEEGVKLSLRHRLDSDITCDAEAYQHSRMVAIGVEFECENWPNVATEQVTTRLDLVNELEQRQSRTIWAARWTPFDPEQKSPTLIAKVISAKRAASIAREYFIYTRIVPQLSAAAQTFFPPLQGVYRSGMDGQAYVVLLECSGVVVTTKQLDKDEELRKRIRTALDLIKSEGLSQFNEAVFKVVRREDGRIFIVDWGEAMLTPSFNLSLSLESSVN